MKTWKLKNVVIEKIKGAANDPQTPYGALFVQRRLIQIWEERRNVSHLMGVGIWVCPARFSPKNGDMIDLGTRKLRCNYVDKRDNRFMVDLYCDDRDVPVIGRNSEKVESIDSVKMLIVKAKKDFTFDEMRIRKGTLGIAIFYGNADADVIFSGKKQKQWSLPLTKMYCDVIDSDCNYNLRRIT